MKLNHIFILVMLFFILFSCAQPELPNEPDSGSLGGSLRLEFITGQTRAIQVTEYEVTKLTINITGSQEKIIEWYPDSDSLIYLELKMGSYTIDLTHFVIIHDATVKYEESAKFEIKPYVVTAIKIIPGGIGITEIGDTDNTGTDPTDPGTGETDPDTTTDITVFQNKIVGQWVGEVTTPWTEAYSVEINFKADGTYSARNLSKDSYPAFYYGTDADSEIKTYYIYDVYSSGSAVGKITILFDVGTTNISKLDYITFSNNYNNLTFEYWHRSEYGPVTFTLTRREL